MTEEEVVNYQPIETDKLQLRSLEAFAEALGYAKAMWYFDDCLNFYSLFPENKHRKTISFNTMVRLYNGHFMECHGKYFNEPFTVDAYRMRVAQASKIVWKVKLQYCKKTKRIICQDHNVAFVDPQYEQLVLGK